MLEGSVFAFCSVGLYLIGSVPYLRGILKKQITPHPFSFGVWSILTGVNLAILLQTGGGWGILPALTEFGFVTAWAVFGIIGIKRIQINMFDYICLFLGIVALIVWMTLPEEYAAAATIVVEVVAFLPSVKKGWINPSSETVFPWVMSGLFPIFLLLAMPVHTFSNSGFWVFIACTNGGFALMLFLRGRSLATKAIA